MKTKKRIGRFRRIATAALLLLLVGVLAGAGAWAWVCKRVDETVRDRIQAVAERAGMTATVNDVDVDIDGTVLVHGVTLHRGTSTFKVHQIRLVTDLETAWDTRGPEAITEVQVQGAHWHEAGEPAARELMARLKDIARDVRKRGVHSDVDIPSARRSLPRLSIADATLSTDAGTLLQAHGSAGAGKGGRLEWSASGTLALQGDEPVSFLAAGQEKNGRLLGRIRVELPHAISLLGPRGTRISGVHDIVYEGGVARTGACVLSDRARKIQLRVEGIRVLLSEAGLPQEGRFEGTTALVVGSRQIITRDIRFLDGGRRVELSAARLTERGRRVKVGRLSVDLDTGRIIGRRITLTLDHDQLPAALQRHVPVGPVEVRATRLRVQTDLPRLAARSWRLAFPAGLDLEGVRIAAGDVQLRLDELALRPTDEGFRLRAAGDLTRVGTEHPMPITLDVRADHGAKPLWAKLSGRRIPLAWAPEAIVAKINLNRAALADLDFTLYPEEGGGLDRLNAEGRVSLTDFGVQHWRLAPGRFLLDAPSAQFSVKLDRPAETVELSIPKLRVGQAEAAVTLKIAGFKKRPFVDLRVQLPEQDCAHIVDAFPVAVRPNLANLVVRGTTHLDAHLRVNLADTRKIKLDITGDLDSCRIITLGPALDRRVARLKGRFVHEPHVGGEDLGVKVGPGTRGYVPFDQIPEFIKEAAMATEDRAFMHHNGFRTSLIRGALKLNLKHLRYVYGGSTISQQLVKNLFLTRRKDLMRKFEEAVLVVALERTLSKRRILELYLNCIEYGPRIWGLTAAAQAYYDKRPQELSVVEGVYLMAIKPYPKHGYWNAKRNRWKKNWVRRMHIIFKRIHKSGAIDSETFEAAGPEYRPVFVGIHPHLRPAVTPVGPDLPPREDGHHIRSTPNSDSGTPPASASVRTTDPAESNVRGMLCQQSVSVRTSPACAPSVT